MVLQRANVEIAKQQDLGKPNLPRLQPRGSIDGFEMFGFTFPPIIQAIEALDINRTCKDYWGSRPLAHDSQPEVRLPNLVDRDLAEHERHLRGLFSKANAEELHSLLAALREEATDGVKTVIRLVEEEIQERL